MKIFSIVTCHNYDSGKTVSSHHKKGLLSDTAWQKMCNDLPPSRMIILWLREGGVVYPARSYHEPVDPVIL